MNDNHDFNSVETMRGHLNALEGILSRMEPTDVGYKVITARVEEAREGLKATIKEKNR